MAGQSFHLAIIASLLLLLPLTAQAIQFTIGVPVGADRCFHFTNLEIGGKVALYFAALNGDDAPLPFSVTAGDKSSVFAADDKRTGDYVFTLQQLGRYDVCFSNRHANVQMIVDADFIIEDKSGVVRHLKDDLNHHNHKPIRDVHNSAAIDDAMFKISGGLHSASRTLKYIKTREARSFDTVTSTESRIFWFALFESALIVGMAALQVFAVRKLFNVPKAKGRV